MSQSARNPWPVRLAIAGAVLLILGAFLLNSQGDAIDEVQRIETVALGFRHFLAFGIRDEAVDVHRVERNLVGKVQGHHDHSSDPKENDVVPRYQGT